MRTGAGFLATVVGRRLFTRFLFAALLPVAVLSAVAYQHVKTELRRQVELRVSRNAKAAGLNTLASLERLEAVFVHVVLPVLAQHSNPGEGDLPAGFTLASTRPLLDGIPAFGEQTAPRALSDAERARLARGETLMVVAGSRDESAVFLARMLAASSTNSRVAWARVSSMSVWSAIEQALQGEAHELCVTESSGRVLHCARRPTVEAFSDLEAAQGRGNRQPVEWSDGDARYLSAGWNVFLQFQYGSADWKVVVSENAAESEELLARFMVTFLLVSILALCVVFFLSHTHIRRSTEPLEQLRQGTRRIANGDFSTPVVVQSRDEFQELATSFNAMSRSLDHQLLSLRNLDALHQAVLGARELRPLVETAAERFGALIPGSDIVIALADRDGTIAMSAARGQVSAGRGDKVRLSIEERLELATQPRQLMVENGASRSYVRLSGLQDGHPDVLVLPLWQEETLLGMVMLARASIDGLDQEQRSSARRLADRFALGVTDVQLVQHLDALGSGALTGFARAVDANSPWTAGHSERVTAFSILIGDRLALCAAELATLRRGGLLHDIGKIGVPPAILDKAGPLTEAERATMESHPAKGAHILEPLGMFSDAIPIVRSHHERLDGSGYPDRLRGEEIPLLARVLAVGDVFDALVSDRPYRAGLPVSKAVAIIRQGTGTHFDGRAVEAFLRALQEGAVDPIVSEARATAALAGVIAPASQREAAAA